MTAASTSDSIDRLVDFYLQIGSTGLTVLGQLGEAPKLEPWRERGRGAPHDPRAPQACR
jgi:dihydrodipicolinate synthase/N-acetylneuraminate lyase